MEQEGHLAASNVPVYPAITPDPPEKILKPPTNIIGNYVSVGRVHCEQPRSKPMIRVGSYPRS